MGSTSGAPLLPAFWDEWTLASLISNKPDRTDSEYLAKPFSYHRIGKNLGYDLHILPRQLWGGWLSVSARKGSQKIRRELNEFLVLKNEDMIRIG